MSITLTIAAALLLDALLGEPRRFHPLVGFGTLAQSIERWVYADRRFHGGMALLLAVVPFIGLAVCFSILSWHFVLDILLLYLVIGWNSLGVHARNVRNALLADNLEIARQQTGYLVSRDTAQLDRTGVTQGTIESVLENGNDAIFGAIFWFVVAGAPGAIAYRLINTLDAMWGYRNDRYRHFGWAAARLDDVMNFIPARLTALGYSLCGHTRTALFCWQTQGPRWKSPNAGPVMAAGAGSLGLSLGGPACYHGRMESRPRLGIGRIPDIEDIDPALRLIHCSLVLWLLVIGTGEGLIEIIQHI